MSSLALHWKSFQIAAFFPLHICTTNLTASSFLQKTRYILVTFKQISVDKSIFEKFKNILCKIFNHLSEQRPTSLIFIQQAHLKQLQ